MERLQVTLRLSLIFVVLLPLRSEGGRGIALDRSISGDQSRVSVDFYYETLCPYCSNFIVLYLQMFFTNGLIDIVDLHLVPYGNAKIINGTIECQHGPYECLLNTVEACAINLWPDVHEHFSFIYCVEALVLQKQYTTWESCFTKNGTDIRRIADCYNSGRGKTLELEYQAETSSLEPPHRYGPWVIVNGAPLYEDYRNVTKYICKAYKGVLPEACKSLSVELIVENGSQYKQVTCADEIMSTSTV